MEILKRADPPPAVFGRRGFLTSVGASLVYAAVAEYAWPRSASAQRLGGDPFTLGVASGDPTPDGVVLWTRLALDPLEGNGGMPDRPVVVQWRIAADEQMWRIVDRGSVWALPALGHSVHVEVEGLRPGRWYFYQFKVGNEYSPIGRTRTAPANNTGELSFAFVSCQHYANGLYHAHRHLAQESLDFAVHLGDYIYEGPSTSPVGRPHLPDHEITSIEDYRIRYGQYKSDADLRAVHAAFPWIVTWDDHETENDYAGFTPENPADPADNMPDFASRRARAYQAYYENMPLRAAQLPVGPYLQLYRRLRFGSLISLNVLDTRQYRTHRAPANCPIEQRVTGYCPEALDRTRSIEGESQQQWLVRGLQRSNADWNVLANQVPFAPNDTNADPALQTFGGEKWDGYPWDRQQILDVLQQRDLGNTIVITGDVHVNFVRNVPPNHVHLDAAPVATEFIGTSISTGGDRALSTVFGGNVNNPHLQFTDNHHGYVRCTVTPDQFRADYRVVPTVLAPVDGGISTVASFAVLRGRAGAVLI